MKSKYVPRINHVYETKRNISIESTYMDYISVKAIIEHIIQVLMSFNMAHLKYVYCSCKIKLS